MDFTHLVALCHRHVNDNTGRLPMPPRLSVYRREAVSDIEASLYEPVVCLVVQGGKIANIGNQFVELLPGDALLVSHDLPVVSRISRASAREPYLALILSLDLALLRSLHDQVLDAPAPEARVRSLSVGRAEDAWLAPLVRYFELMNDARDARILGPAILLETHYRLLLSPMGKMLRQLAIADSHASRIAKAIQQLKAEYQSPLSVSDLASTAGMSLSSFHQHFKSVTGTTPLQYLKDIRLIAAKAMLLNRSHAVSQVSYAIGYESPTHFSRDYRRKFGLPPSKDMGFDVVAAKNFPALETSDARARELDG